MALLLLHAAPAFFTPPHGQIPHSADPTTGETEEVGERMTYAFGVSTTDMLVSQMQTFINDEAGGGCSATGCTADQFEWATDQAAAAYIAGGGSVPTEDVIDFLLACAQEMGYEGVVPASISA